MKDTTVAGIIHNNNNKGNKKGPLVRII